MPHRERHDAAAAAVAAVRDKEITPSAASVAAAECTSSRVHPHLSAFI